MSLTSSRVALLYATLLALALAAGCRFHSPPGVGLMQPDEYLVLVAAGNAPQLVDTRTPDEYAAGHIPGALNVPHREVRKHLEQLEPYKQRGLVTYCDTGPRSAVAQRALQQAGFTELWQLAGNMSGWTAAGRQVVTGPEPE